MIFDLIVITAVYVASITVAWSFGYQRGRADGRDEINRRFGIHKGRRTWR